MADVARPTEIKQRLTGLRVDLQPLRPRLLRQQKIEQLRLVTAITQGGQGDFQPVEPVVQVFAKAALLHAFQQIAMGGADDAHVDGLRLATDRHHQTVFKHTQQTSLHGQRHVADLIEKQRSAIGLLQLALHAFLAGTGKTAAAIAEQFTFNQAFRNRRAVERHKGLVGAQAGQMHRFGEGFFARAGFTIDQQRYVALEDPQRPAKIGVQRVIAQADPAQARRCGVRLNADWRGLSARQAPQCGE